MTYFCGIDVGSVTTKIVLTKNEDISNLYILPSGSNYKRSAENAIAEILKDSELKRSDISAIVSTGCGADRVDFADAQIGDLLCCAMGTHRLFPDINSIIEVGGQATKVIRLNQDGKIIDFLLSEKCASGSGRFLQVIARVLQINIADVGELSRKSTNPVKFNTSCAVFGESEAISRISEGAKKEDIIAGIHQSMATKIATMAERISIAGPCVMLGGGALDDGLIYQLEKLIFFKVNRAKNPQIINAYGAAIHAKQNS